MSDTIDVTKLTDDDLRRAVAEAHSRLPHSEVCTHCADERERNLAGVHADLREVQEYNARAAAAGYVVGGKRGTIHRWDCSSIQSYITAATGMAEYVVTSDDASVLRHGAQFSLPRIVTAEQARELLSRPTPKRTTCRTCSPDL